MHEMDLSTMWVQMRIIPKAVVFMLLVMSIYSIVVGLERITVYSRSKKQPQHVLRLMGKFWQEDKIEESINVSLQEKFRNSLLAKVLAAGLKELGFQEDANTPYEEKVGLFGTTLGVVTEFQGMAIAHSPGFGVVAAGIAEALITTAFGILVAVIAVIFFIFLLNKVDIFTGELANASSELINHYIKKKEEDNYGYKFK
jgi:biopolymer transport protein ExbB/TolQ